LRVINTTLRMYTCPSVMLNKPRMWKVYEAAVAEKDEVVERLGVKKTHLTSKDKFAELLRDAGIEPPTKTSPRTGKETYAMAMGDLAFKKLLGHENKRVRDLVQGRSVV